LKDCVGAPIAAASLRDERKLPILAFADIRGRLGRHRVRNVAWQPLNRPKFPPWHRVSAPKKKTFTDSEITDGFFKTAFGAEYHLAGRVDRIRKYDAPVRVFADGNRPDRKAQLGTIVADIAERFSISTSPWRKPATEPMFWSSWCAIAIFITPSRHFTAANGHARSAVRSIRKCLSGFRKNDKFEIEHSDVILTVDNGDFVFFDCGIRGTAAITRTDQRHQFSALDHVQRQRVDGIFRRLRSVHPQYSVRSTDQGRHDCRGGQGGAPEVLTDVRIWVRKVNNLAE